MYCLGEPEYMAALPSSAGPICMGPGLSLGLGLPETLALSPAMGLKLAARGLAFVAPDLSLGLGRALAVTGLVLVLMA